MREEVVEGRLRPGSRLPEQQICTALRVSRNTVREAMSQLVTERVLVREPHRGLFVARPDRAAIRDVYRARRVIEPGAVRASDAVGATRLAAVRDAVEEGRAAAAEGRWDDLASANQHFHRALVERWFSDVKRGPDVVPLSVPPTQLTSITKKTITDRVQLPRVYLAWTGPAVFRPGDAELDVVADVLAGGKTSRLYKRLIYDLQIAQNVFSFQQAGDL